MGERLHKPEQSIGRRLVIGLGSAALLAAIGIGSYLAVSHRGASAPTFSVPKGDSLSPFATATYPGTPGVSKNEGSWKEAVTVTDHNGQELLFAFASPGSKNWDKVSVISSYLSSSNYLLIGPSNVEFGVAVIGKTGSEATTSAPSVTFSPEMPTSQINANGVSHWEIPRPAILAS